MLNANMLDLTVGGTSNMLVLSIAPIADSVLSTSQYLWLVLQLSSSADALMLKYSVGSMYSTNVLSVVLQSNFTLLKLG